MSETANVVYAKPKKAGPIYHAPIGSTLPTDASAELDAAFVSLGYISEDGLTNSNSPETSDIKAWGGDVVMSPMTGRPDTFSFTVIEGAGVETLKVVYGSDNVTGTLKTGVTVKASTAELENECYVVDMVLRGNILKRIVIPNAVVTSVGDVSYKDSEAVGYEITLTAYPDNSGNTHYEYMKGATA